MLARTLPQGVEETIERGLHEVFSSLGRVRFRLENGRLTGTALYRTAETDNDGRTNPDFAEGDPCAVLFVRVVCSFWRLNLTLISWKPSHNLRPITYSFLCTIPAGPSLPLVVFAGLWFRYGAICVVGLTLWLQSVLAQLELMTMLYPLRWTFAEQYDALGRVHFRPAHEGAVTAYAERVPKRAAVELAGAKPKRVRAVAAVPVGIEVPELLLDDLDCDTVDGLPKKHLEPLFDALYDAKA